MTLGSRRIRSVGASALSFVLIVVKHLRMSAEHNYRPIKRDISMNAISKVNPTMPQLHFYNINAKCVINGQVSAYLLCTTGEMMILGGVLTQLLQCPVYWYRYCRHVNERVSLCRLCAPGKSHP